MQFFYHCPDCNNRYSTHADIDKLQDAVNCSITCLCGRDILITSVDDNTNWVECESINYEDYVDAPSFV